jgi:pyruvate dehydrogenase E2 component (dihydrolipoamide acetyltransferase)
MPFVNLTLPESLGDVDQYVIVTWLKQEGDEVAQDETVLEAQVAKVAFEVPSPISGRLVKILANQGDVVARDQVLAYIEPEETYAASPAGGNLPLEKVEELGQVKVTQSGARIAAEKGIDLDSIRGSGPSGCITEKDVRDYIDRLERPKPQEAPASPAAKRAAREHKVDLQFVQGTGSGGRITEGDVQAFIARQAEVKQPDQHAVVAESDNVEIPLTGMRAVIAQRMMESVQTTAQVTLHTEVDMSEIVARHASDKLQLPVTYTDYIVSACAKSLRQHPNINARITDKGLQTSKNINIGLAVSTEDGLIVPVIDTVDRLSLDEIAQERIRLVEKARKGQLIPPDYSGGTFTVTNLGTYEIDGFTPILNQPELAILGVGRIIERVVVYRGNIAKRHMMTLSLTIDHRIIDGAPGAAFLQTIKQLLETAQI